MHPSCAYNLYLPITGVPFHWEDCMVPHYILCSGCFYNYCLFWMRMQLTIFTKYFFKPSPILLFVVQCWYTLCIWLYSLIADHLTATTKCFFLFVFSNSINSHSTPLAFFLCFPPLRGWDLSCLCIMSIVISLEDMSAYYFQNSYWLLLSCVTVHCYCLLLGTLKWKWWLVPPPQCDN